MENENFRKDEEILNEQPEEFVPEAEEVMPEVEEILPEAEDVSPETEEVIAETETTASYETETPDIDETADDIIGDEWMQGETENEGIINAAKEESVRELSEEELEKLEKRKLKQKKKRTIVYSVVGAIVAIAALWLIFVCYIEGVGSGTIVNNPSANVITTEAPKREFSNLWGLIGDDNIRFENPAVTLYEKVTGKNKNVAFTVNGKPVSKGIFGYMMNYKARALVQYRLSIGGIKDLNNIDWDDIEKTSGNSYMELAKEYAINELKYTYALVADGEKHGVKLDEADQEEINKWFNDLKKSVTDSGEDFEESLKRNGYDNEQSLLDLYTLTYHADKVYEDMGANPDKYITEDVKAKFNDDKVTVKHILILTESPDGTPVSDEVKAEAKKKAEEVLAKAKNGEDFDALIEEYNEDPGATPEGYTFANNGAMVQEFADASFALEIGGISDIVETHYGYHIIKRLDRHVGIEEYLSTIDKDAEIIIKKGAFDDVEMTLDFAAIFSSAQNTQSQN